MRKNMKKKWAILSIFITIFLTGCRKEFWEYECIWYSESPYVYIETQGHDAIIEVDGVLYDITTGWENDGTGITFYSKSIDEGRTEESIIWVSECKVKGGKLYLTIIEDRVSDMDGETIILEQKAYTRNVINRYDETIKNR